jgi:HD-GYP domain-containing protein (c-di-GMP phosphodiesterase class II)
MEDSSAQKRAQIQVESAAERRARRFLDMSQNGFLVSEAGSGLILDANVTLLAWLGYPLAELQQLSFWDGKFNKNSQDCRQAFLGLQPVMEFRREGLILTAKNGSPVQLWATGRVFREDTQDVIQWIFREIDEMGPARQQVLRLNHEIKILYQASQELNRTLDLEILYDLFCRLTMGMMALDVMYVSSYDPGQQAIRCVYAFADGKRIDISQFPPLPLEPEGQGTQSRVIRSGQPWLLSDYKAYQRTAQHYYTIRNDGQIASEQEIIEEKDHVSSAIIVPIKLREQVVGVVQIFSYRLDAYSQDDLEHVMVLTAQFAVASNNARLYQQAQSDISLREQAEQELLEAYNTTIAGLMHALDMRDRETEHHSRRVTEMTVRLAREFGLSEKEVAVVRIGAQLHDIGKLGVPDAILWKEAALTETEWVTMKKHTSIGYDILWPIQHLRPAIDIPYCHHEKWDGSGYPRGLKGEEIPLAARIFAVVDVWDALTSDRRYRSAWSPDTVREYILAESGKHFDPEVVRVCLAADVLV